MDERIVLTDKGKVVLAYMQSNDKVLVGKDIVEETGIKGIYPILNSLINKGLVDKSEPETREFTNNKGETKPKDYKTYVLTNKGRNYEIN